MRQPQITQTLPLSPSNDIKEHEYAAFRWISLTDFSPEEIAVLEKEWAEIPNLDGFDTEGYCCFKFGYSVPRHRSEISVCKIKNERIANKRMGELAKIFKRYKYYFNPSKLFIKKL